MKGKKPIRITTHNYNTPMKKLGTVLLILLSTAAFGQINLADSTAQIIAYWNVGEKQSYSISLQKIRLSGTDTTSNETMTYDVDVTVVDSTANSYVVEWFYHNYKTNSTNEIVKKVIALSEDLKVRIETDEFGSIKGVQNWEEVAAYMKKSLAKVKNDFPEIPQFDQVLQQIEGMYTSKEAIETAAILDAHQFHSFHGGKYTKGEVLEYSMPVANMFKPNKPFDSKVTLYLDEINSSDNNVIIRSTQEVDPKQLSTATFEYLQSMAKTMDVPKPKKEDKVAVANVTTTASRIHETGWLIYSIQTKTIEVPGATNIEERIIEIQ